jgi:hypothetical protein
MLMEVLDWNVSRMGVSMPYTQPHQYILMQNMQQMSPGLLRLTISFRKHNT